MCKVQKINSHAAGGQTTQMIADANIRAKATRLEQFRNSNLIYPLCLLPTGTCVCFYNDIIGRDTFFHVQMTCRCRSSNPSAEANKLLPMTITVVVLESRCHYVHLRPLDAVPCAKIPSSQLHNCALEVCNQSPHMAWSS